MIRYIEFNSLIQVLLVGNALKRRTSETLTPYSQNLTELYSLFLEQVGRDFYFCLSCFCLLYIVISVLRMSALLYDVCAKKNLPPTHVERR